MIEVGEIADENGPIIIICRSGRRSRIVSNMIIKENINPPPKGVDCL